MVGEKMHKDSILRCMSMTIRCPKFLDGVSASILYRAVRELLINAARHAQVGAARSPHAARTDYDTPVPISEMLLIIRG